MKLFFLMGCTCAGKGTFIRILKSYIAEGKLSGVGFVEVGQEFRRRYPPEHFQGQANPKHLMAEAIQIYDELLAAERAKGMDAVIVDGQPRQGQVIPILNRLHDEDFAHFILLDAPGDVRSHRLAQRFQIGTPEHASGLARITNDWFTYYQTLVELLRQDQKIHVIDTNRDEMYWAKELVNLISKLWDSE